VAERTGVRRETLEGELQRPPSAGRRSAPAEEGRPAAVHRLERATPRPARLGPELSLLKVLARDRERRHERLESILGDGAGIGPQDFRDEVNRAIFQAFLDEPELEAPPAHLTDDARARLDALLAAPADDAEVAHAGRTFADALTAMRRSALQRLADDLDRRIELALDDHEKRTLAGEKARVAKELRGMGQGWAHTARKLRMEPRTSQG